MEVEFGRRAYLDLESLLTWIISEGYPIAAYKFANQILAFCETLNFYPEKYPICRFKVLLKRNYRCAVFAGNYVIVYKFTSNRVSVKRIFHTSRLKE